jgi:hypothetical protein
VDFCVSVRVEWNIELLLYASDGACGKSARNGKSFGDRKINDPAGPSES